MEILKILFVICCGIANLQVSEATEERERRQINGLNGAHTDAMDRSSKGGFGGSYNSMISGNGFGGRLGAGYGGTAWSSGKQSLGLGVAGRADFGLNNGRPFARAPEVGVGATYNRGLNSFSVGAGRAFGSRPSNQFGFSYSRRFRRSTNDENDNESAFEGEEVEELPVFDDENDSTVAPVDNVQSGEDDVTVSRSRQRRQAAMNQAMGNSLTNKPVGHPQFSYQIDAAGNNARNFGASGSAGTGMKVWERGPHSVGVGVGASGDLARINGQTFTGNRQLGAGLGYQNGGFSASVGAGRTLGRFPSNHYGLNLGYRFKRSLDNSDDEHDEVESAESHEIEEDESEIIQHLNRHRRQTALNSALANTFTNKNVGRPQFSYDVNGAGNNLRNFGGSGAVGAGVKVWERGPHSVGAGVGASGGLQRINGKTYTGNYQAAAGVGYHHKGGFSATAGVGQGVGPFKTKPYGMVNFSYRFPK